VKEVAVELYGYLEKIGFTFMGEPGMRNIGPDKDQFPVFYLFHTVSDDAFDAFGVFDKIQFIFLMIMYGEVKLCLMPGKHRETIGLFKWGSFL